MANQESNNPEPWNNLEGKVVLVTGASSGLGREFCLNLAQAGCKIVVAARRTDQLKALCDEINHPAFSGSPSNPNTTVRAVAVELDVTADDPTIDASAQKAWNRFGRIDVLINNAGFRGTVKNSLELDEEEWGLCMKTNLNGTWLVSKHVCRRMRDGHQGGSIINISSVIGINRGQHVGDVGYAASKTGINAMTKLNNVALKMVPLQTFGSLDPAVTSLVRFLVHDSSQYITGNIFIVDAGSSLPGIPIFSSL
ncbi:hypothetical protein PVL29_010043 [Vitis rotundifolia]|uniref:Uncharacterized protein n=1 Tax=Vitis rotundifolia TaxID=103349 RepID=A0AA38ZSC8_VITRO|nr:hypothetical protein PVL29_010043 [Vitis rotundifolia]